MTISFFTTRENLAHLHAYDSWVAEETKIIDQDDTHVMGYIFDNGIYDRYIAGEIVNPDTFADHSNLWFAPNGNAHYVPCYSHYVVAGLMGSTIETLENRGWVHLSGGTIFNNEVKVNDRLYDVLAHYCDIHRAGHMWPEIK